MNLTLPPSNSLLDSPRLVSATQAKQISQLTSGVPSKRKIRGHNDFNSILPQEPTGCALDITLK